MSLPGSLRAVFVGLCCAALLSVAGPASADALQDCVDQGNAQGIQFPTCIEEGGKLVPVESVGGGFDADPGSADDGFVGLFVALFVLTLVAGIAIAVWKMDTARKLAKDAGMDPDLAAGMTLMDENGLSATYLASSLRNSKPSEPAAAAPHPAASDRLGELKQLLDGGLITQAEYDERRKAIIDSV